MAQTARWLPLKQAAALLGVDEGTLRHWADLGKVRTFRTPGGHRRFLEADVRALMAPAADGGIAAAILHGSLLAGPSARRLRASEWFSSLDEGFREKARERGRRLVDLLGRSVGGHAARQVALAQVRAIGREYGAELRGSGLTLLQATEAFCIFRDMVLTKATRRGSTGGEVRLVHDVSRLLDQLLLAIVGVYETPEPSA